MERSFQEKVSKVSIVLEKLKKAVKANGSLLEYDTLKKADVVIDQIILNHLSTKDSLHSKKLKVEPLHQDVQ